MEQLPSCDFYSTEISQEFSVRWSVLNWSTPQGIILKYKSVALSRRLLGADLVLIAKPSCTCSRGWCLHPHAEQTPTVSCEMVSPLSRQLQPIFFPMIPTILQVRKLHVSNTLPCLLSLKCVVRPYQ